MRIVLAALTVVVMAAALAGVGMGQSPAEAQPAPSASQVAAARQRIAAGGAAVARGRALFADESCDACHSIAAIDAQGKLGPRLDTLDDDDADDIAEQITEPRKDTADGFPEQLMPTDYAERMRGADVRALAAFVAAASGSGDAEDAGAEDARAEGDEDSGRGRGRGGRSGRGGGGED